MAQKKKKPGPTNLERAMAEARAREKEYRARALKIYPHICGRCGREFKGERLRELTVHHKDHDHENNPPDGSNWELLCLFCHENEHSPYLTKEWYNESPPVRDTKPGATFRPLADLGKLLGEKDTE